MGLLDDLEKEAERQREDDVRSAAERVHREQIWRDSLEPAMHALEDYLRQLTEKLSYLKRRLRVVYPLHGYGDVTAQIDPHFTLRGEPSKNAYDIVLEFVGQVVPEECPAIQADSMARVKTLSSVLQQHGLGGLSDPRKSPNGDVVAARFQARGKIPMSMTVSASVDTGMARFQFNNLEGFGQSSRSFSAEQLNADLFDALGRFLTREEPRFAQESVSEDVRRQLQSKLQRDQMRRDWESKLARQLAEDEAKVVDSLDPGAKPGWLLGRLRLLSVKLFGR